MNRDKKNKESDDEEQASSHNVSSLEQRSNDLENRLIAALSVKGSNSQIVDNDAQPQRNPLTNPLNQRS